MIRVDKTLYEGQPENVNERNEVEQDTYACLSKLGISFYRMDHDAAMTIADCEEIDKTLGTPMCKNLLLCNRQKTNFYLLLLPGGKQFQTKQLSSQINSARLSFADGSYMEEYLRIKPGSLSVLGLMNDKENHVRLLIDKEILDADWICCHPCINTSSLKIKTKDILEVFLPYTKHEYQVVELT